MTRELAQRRCWILLELKHVASDNRVKWALKNHLGGIALIEADVRERLRGRARPRDRKRARRAVDANNLAAVAEDSCRKEGNIASTSADVEDAHPRRHPGFAKEALGDRFDEPGLRLQALDLALGMAQYIRPRGVRAARVLAHTFLIDQVCRPRQSAITRLAGSLLPLNVNDAGGAAATQIALDAAASWLQRMQVPAGAVVLVTIAPEAMIDVLIPGAQSVAIDPTGDDAVAICAAIAPIVLRALEQLADP